MARTGLCSQYEVTALHVLGPGPQGLRRRVQGLSLPLQLQVGASSVYWCKLVLVLTQCAITVYLTVELYWKKQISVYVTSKQKYIILSVICRLSVVHALLVKSLDRPSEPICFYLYDFLPC